MAQNNTGFLARAIRDPLIHFLILGGLLFIGVSLWDSGRNDEHKIIITPQMRTRAAALFEATEQRKPTASELEALMDEQIKEEIYYREALKLGLDKDDTVIRRRLRQKLEFLQEDTGADMSPSEAELRSYYNAHKDSYISDRHLSFSQVLLSPKQLAPEDRLVVEAKAALNGGASPNTLTRSRLLPVSMKRETAKAVSDTFGTDFLTALLDQTPGIWAGPISSGFGTHLVRLEENDPPRPLRFEEARSEVLRDVRRARREKAAHDFYESLRKNYTILRQDKP